jgi:hypothetical protein
MLILRRYKAQNLWGETLMWTFVEFSFAIANQRLIKVNRMLNFRIFGPVWRHPAWGVHPIEPMSLKCIIE